MKLTETFGLPYEDIDSVVTSIGNSWEKLSGKSILITGGTGFLGKWIVESAIEAVKKHDLNIKIYLPTRRPNTFVSTFPNLQKLQYIKVFHANLSLAGSIAKHHYDYVIHGATDVVSNQTPKETFYDILHGTETVINASSHTDSNCKFLLLSSGAVYGSPPAGEYYFDEDSEIQFPLSNSLRAYGEGKRVSELLCALEQRNNPNFQYNIARCFAFVGPYLGLNKHFAIGNFIGDALENREIKIQGDGTPLRSYQYTSDLAIHLWKILLDGLDGDVFNVGGDKAISIEDLAKLVNSSLQTNCEVQLLTPPVTNASPISYLPNTRKITERLGVYNKVSLEDAILKTANWYSQRAKGST